jgi:hypothetical protein
VPDTAWRWRGGEDRSQADHEQHWGQQVEWQEQLGHFNGASFDGYRKGRTAHGVDIEERGVAKSVGARGHESGRGEASDSHKSCFLCVVLHTIPYHTIPYHTIPYHTIPYRTIPYHTILYRNIPYHTIPYHTISYHSIAYNSIA